jgi:hypothetical protein
MASRFGVAIVLRVVSRSEFVLESKTNQPFDGHKVYYARPVGS